MASRTLADTSLGIVIDVVAVVLIEPVVLANPLYVVPFVPALPVTALGTVQL